MIQIGDLRDPMGYSGYPLDYEEYYYPPINKNPNVAVDEEPNSPVSRKLVPQYEPQNLPVDEKSNEIDFATLIGEDRDVFSILVEVPHSVLPRVYQTDQPKLGESVLMSSSHIPIRPIEISTLTIGGTPHIRHSTNLKINTLKTEPFPVSVGPLQKSILSFGIVTFTKSIPARKSTTLTNTVTPSPVYVAPHPNTLAGKTKKNIKRNAESMAPEFREEVEARTPAKKRRVRCYCVLRRYCDSKYLPADTKENLHPYIQPRNRQNLSPVYSNVTDNNFHPRRPEVVDHPSEKPVRYCFQITLQIYYKNHTILLCFLLDITNSLLYKVKPIGD